MLKVADLDALIEEMAQRYGEILTEVWIVDRPGMEPKVREFLRPEKSGISCAAWGVKIITVNNRLVEPEETKLQRPMFSTIPGVWLRYSNGRLKMLKEVTNG